MELFSPSGSEHSLAHRQTLKKAPRDSSICSLEIQLLLPSFLEPRIFIKTAE